MSWLIGFGSESEQGNGGRQAGASLLDAESKERGETGIVGGGRCHVWRTSIPRRGTADYLGGVLTVDQATSISVDLAAFCTRWVIPYDPHLTNIPVPGRYCVIVRSARWAIVLVLGITSPNVRTRVCKRSMRQTSPSGIRNTIPRDDLEY